ncbi:pyrroline-5-carboxylate reductase, partial [Candidatus Bathyarchaeota archaeon]
MKGNVAVIGTGTIGGAILKSLLKSEYTSTLIATRRNIEQLREFEKLGVVIT